VKYCKAVVPSAEDIWFFFFLFTTMLIKEQKTFIGELEEMSSILTQCLPLLVVYSKIKCFFDHTWTFFQQ